MPTPADHRKQFIKAFESLTHHRERHDVFADFLDMAVCAIRKTTLPSGQAANAIEAQYMAVVKRNAPEDVRKKIPTLLGITALAVQEGGCDFLGQVVGDLELLNDHMGQFFTPYDVSCQTALNSFQVTACKNFQLIGPQGRTDCLVAAPNGCVGVGATDERCQSRPKPFGNSTA